MTTKKKESSQKKKERGKKSRKSGAAFEGRVRKDLEGKGWICDRWSNNVEIFRENREVMFAKSVQTKLWGKLIPAKHKFRGPGIPMSIGTGFPDFITFKFYKGYNGIKTYEIIGVEVKSNGYLDKEERAKCQWYLDNHIFSSIKIARKTKVKNRIVIEYRDFKTEFVNKASEDEK